MYLRQVCLGLSPSSQGSFRKCKLCGKAQWGGGLPCMLRLLKGHLLCL